MNYPLPTLATCLPSPSEFLVQGILEVFVVVEIERYYVCVCVSDCCLILKYVK